MLLIYANVKAHEDLPEEGHRWAVVEGGIWTEFVTQKMGDAAAAGAGRSFGETDGVTYRQMRSVYLADGRVRAVTFSA